MTQISEPPNFQMMMMVVVEKTIVFLLIRTMITYLMPTTRR